MTRISLLILFSLLLISARCQHSRPNADTGDAYVHRPGSMDGTGKFYLGREIAQIMGSNGAMWLERDEREKEENTSAAIRHMKLSPESVVADIGAGTGYYTFRIASKVPKGKVYAVEIQDELISILTHKKEDLHSKNVEVIKGDTQSANLPANSIDLVVMVDVYHELLYPNEMLSSIRKALKPKGKLLLLEYKAEDPSVAIKKLHKMSVAQVTRELSANKFSLFYRGDFLPIQHFLIFQKE